MTEVQIGLDEDVILCHCGHTEDKHIKLSKEFQHEGKGDTHCLDFVYECQPNDRVYASCCQCLKFIPKPLPLDEEISPCSKCGCETVKFENDKCLCEKCNEVIL